MAKIDISTKKGFRVCLIGGETMLGREIQEVLQSRSKETLVSAYSATAEGTFGEQEGEAIYVEPLTVQSVAQDQALVLAGSDAGPAKAFELVKAVSTKPVILDAAGHLEKQKGAVLTSTLLAEVKAQAGDILVLAHPAAAAIALVFARLSRAHTILRSVVNVLEPASERGKRGISELHQQTTSLLAFKSLDKQVFDAQLSYNLLAQYGPEAPVKLADIEAKIRRHLGKLSPLLQRTTALRVIQAPVFHAYSLSLWIEFDAQPEASEIGEALASAQIEVRSANEEPPTNVGAAGQSGLLAGDIRIDPSNKKALWLWVVFDNLRLVADSVADIVSVMRQGKL